MPDGPKCLQSCNAPMKFISAGVFSYWSCTSCHARVKHQEGWKYCPYCGCSPCPEACPGN